ncbi:importin subunit alpha [Anaeramoeba flamelloides]|uniref:Importin subunit alpha n=1 Tax=Anaeramoeba flamelloides TaxID=1746091 RepID=A0AAV7YM14_9EUKA|nr:importin subunit alpha [Anaeramoeba flamelloides]KAJ6238522.1 importin subunit alpha [Anaeramoeba flamelloides]
MSDQNKQTHLVKKKNNNGEHYIVKLEHLAKYIKQFKSNNPFKILTGISNIRYLVSMEKGAEVPIQRVFESGIVPRILTMLRQDNWQIANECSWTLANLSGGTRSQTQTLVDYGAIPPLLALLTSTSPELQNNAIWTLGNIAGDSKELRDILLDAQIHCTFLELLKSGAKLSCEIRQALTWATENLLRWNPRPTRFNFEAFLKPICDLLFASYQKENQVFVNCLWCLCYLTNPIEKYAQQLLNYQIIDYLLKAVDSGKHSLINPALRVMGNFTSGNEIFTQAIVDCGVFKILPKLFKITRIDIRRETAWMLSNIVSGTESQKQALIDTNILQYLIQIFPNEPYLGAVEICWIFANLAITGNQKQVNYLYKIGVLDTILNRLKDQETQQTEFIKVSLETIFGIISNKKNKNSNYHLIIKNKFIQINGLEILNNLLKFQTNEIKHLINSIIQLISSNNIRNNRKNNDSFSISNLNSESNLSKKFKSQTKLDSTLQLNIKKNSNKKMYNKNSKKNFNKKKIRLKKNEDEILTLNENSDDNYY